MLKPSRRQFLKWVGLFSSAALLPASVLARAPIRRFSQPYLDWMRTPHLAPMNELFAAAIEDRTISFVLYDLSRSILISAIQPELPLPIASAFKAPLLMYFTYMVDPAVWTSVPVEHWDKTQVNAVPVEYQAGWRSHARILNDLYKMITISDNDATGRVLAYVGRIYNTTEPLVLFNEWAHGIVGISQLSGLSDWYFGMPTSLDGSDHRYGGFTTIDRQNYQYGNLFTARDMGLFYTWFLDEMTPQQQLVCGTLLTQIYADRRANIERLAAANQGMAFSKNGTLGNAQSAAGVVITDAGIVQHGNGTTYLVVILAVNAQYQVPEVFEIADQVLKGYYDDFILQGGVQPDDVSGLRPRRGV